MLIAELLLSAITLTTAVRLGALTGTVALLVRACEELAAIADILLCQRKMPVASSEAETTSIKRSVFAITGFSVRVHPSGILALSGAGLGEPVTKHWELNAKWVIFPL